jgi:hypothetical protein
MTKKKVVEPIVEKKLWSKVWGDASLLSRTGSVATLCISCFVLFGYFSGCFDGCRDDFEDNRVNAKQDTLIKANTDSAQSFDRYRFYQRKRNVSYDSLFELLDLYRDK